MSRPASSKPKKPGTKSAARLSTKPVSVLSANEHTALLRRPGPKAGLPGNLPRLHVGADGPTNLPEVLAALESAHRQGYGCALLEALRHSFIWAPHAGVPGWVRGAYCEALEGWKTHRYATLEDAFIARRPRSRQASAHFQAIYGGMVFLQVKEARAAGVSIDKALYAAIGNRFGQPAHVIERVYSQQAGIVASPAGAVRRKRTRTAD